MKMTMMKSPFNERKMKVTVNKFPVGDNIPCWISNAETDGRYIIITHKTLVDDPRVLVGRKPKREDGKMWIRLSHYIKIDTSNFLNVMHHICSVLDIDDTEIRKMGEEERINSYTQEIKEKRNAKYYLKTLVRENTNGFYVTKGSYNIPFMSKEPDLFYVDGEDSLNQIILK